MKTQLMILVLFLCSIGASAQAQDSSKVSDRYQKNMVNIAWQSEGAITKEKLINAGELSVSKHAVDEFILGSFRFTLVKMSEGTTVEYSNASDGKLTTEMIEEINLAKAGDKIYFEYIKLKHIKDKEMRQVEPMAFKIID